MDVLSDLSDALLKELCEVPILNDLNHLSGGMVRRDELFARYYTMQPLQKRKTRHVIVISLQIVAL